MGVLAAERIKLTSTKSPRWSSVIVVVLGLGLAAVIGITSRISVQSSDRQLSDGNTPDIEPILPSTFDALAGVSGFGVTVLMIMAALTITSEYRFGVIRTTFQATPNRGAVLGAKALLVGVFGLVLTFVLGFGALYLAAATAGADAGELLNLDVDGSWRVVYGTAILAFLQIVIAVGVGALVRQSAGAIALLLLWPLVVESLFGLFGSLGRALQPFLPWANANHFLGQGSDIDFHWGPFGSLLYFIVFTAIIFGAAVLVTNRRDA
ncbi:ABC transporter permease [Rhodococcus sp. 1163]|uniref:ABC transporter permease n=1 Tax=Rhodococcus sp. 1163 TaxID=1905289 RepID=UPI000A05F810|nr:ABC transporter permease [Rhodococcus sp. 1163]ORI20023.1 ABC transporter permease [Rhodococcus sp. 1163]